MLIQSEERDIIGGGAQSFAKMSFIAEVTERTSWGLKMLEFLGTDDLLYSNNYYEHSYMIVINQFFINIISSISLQPAVGVD